MKQEIAKLWTQALRSGEYKQDGGSLRTKKGFCCLGVLCDISGKGKWKGDLLAKTISYQAKSGLETHYLSSEVVEWAGLYHWNPGTGKNVLAQKNDESRSFDEIADIIDLHWEEL